MREAQGLGVQAHAGLRRGVGAVEGVADDGVAQRRQVHAQLVGAAGQRLQGQPGAAAGRVALQG